MGDKLKSQKEVIDALKEELANCKIWITELQQLNRQQLQETAKKHNAIYEILSYDIHSDDRMNNYKSPKDNVSI